MLQIFFVAHTLSQPAPPCPQGFAQPPLRGEAFQDNRYVGCPPNAGPNSCCECPAGMFQQEEGQAFCELCAEGRYSTISGATDESVCIVCPAGYSTSTWDDGVCNDGACYFGQPLDYADYKCCDHCSICPRGLYQPSEGKASCEACPPGMHSDNFGQTNATACNFRSTAMDAAIGAAIAIASMAFSLVLLTLPAKLLV